MLNVMPTANFTDGGIFNKSSKLVQDP